MKSIDIGCGPNKVPGSYGVDIHQYDGVDQTFNLNQTPWPLENEQYDRVYARHVIEHVESIPDFINEIHRISIAGATVEIITPHFSSLDSWQDPTHRWHLSAAWYKTFTDDYLASQVNRFKHLDTNVSFSKSLRSRLGSFMTKARSIHHWEKHYAFIFRAKNITTRLEVVK